MNESDHAQSSDEDWDEDDIQDDEGGGSRIIRRALLVVALTAVLVVAGAVLATAFGADTPLGAWANRLSLGPARASEDLIVIADFTGASGSKNRDVDPAQYLYETLSNQVRADGLPVRVERLHRPVDEAGARSAGQSANAALVLWGEQDATTITPHMERVKTLSAFRSMEVTPQHLTIADPAQTESGAITDPPGQAAYVALFTLALERYSQQDFQRSLTYLNRALAAGPQSAGAAGMLSQAYFLKGNIYAVSTANYSVALANYSRALDLNPDYYEAYINRGNLYYIMAQYSSALADYNHALNLKPGAEVFYDLGVTDHAMQDYPNALVDFAAALELDAQNAAAYNARGDTYYDLGLYRTALADYSQALKLTPKNAQILNRRGVTYLILHNDQAALADFNSAIKLDPKNDKAYDNRGSLHYAMGDYQAALDDFNRALKLVPNDADTYNNRGNTYSALRKYDAAIADFNRALELNPQLIQAYNNRGGTYEAMGQFDKARADLDHFLSLSDDPRWNAVARRRLQEMQGK